MIRKLRFFYRFATAIIKKQWRIIIPGLSLFLLSLLTIYLIFPFLRNNFIYLEKNFFKQTYVEAVIGEPITFNPLFSRMEIEKEINKLVFRGLTKLNSNGSIVGDLAERIEIKNDTEYVFHLKKDIVWHDGKKFNADDVIYTIKLTQNSLYDSVVSSNFKDVEVAKIDDYTISFKLREPFSPFLSATTVGIIPEHISLSNYRPIGTGKFKFAEIKKNSTTLESNNLKLKFNYYPSQKVAETALKLGEVHAITNYEFDSGEFKDWDNFQVFQANLSLRPLALYFNTRDKNLKEKQLRQALAYGIQKKELIEGQDGKVSQLATNSFSAKNTLGISTTDRYSYNEEKAKELLRNLGWKYQENYLYKEGEKLSLSITTLADSKIITSAKKIQKRWKSLGVDVEVNIVSGTELKEQIVPNKIFTVLLTTQLLDPDPDQYVLWHTTQINEANITGISSPKLDKLLEDGRRTTNSEIRKEKYLEFSRLLSDEVPAVFLYYPRYVWVVSDKVKNIDLVNFLEPVDRFSRSNIWRIERKIL